MPKPKKPKISESGKPLATHDVDTADGNISNMKLHNQTMNPNDVLMSKVIPDNLDESIDDIIQQKSEEIWDYVVKDKIKLEYALVGITPTGRKVYGYEALTELLIQYGYTIEVVLNFLDEFQSLISSDEMAAGETKCPILMHSIQHWNIYSDISPISSKKAIRRKK